MTGLCNTTSFFSALATTDQYLRAALAVLLCAFGLSSNAAYAAPHCPSLLNKTFNRLQDEKPVSLCDFSSKVLLVVNTASKCGYTPQYEGLEALHTKLSTKGFSVMGFPSGDFGGQEYSDSKKIADLCFNTYGVNFPIFSKSHVAGVNANPLYQDLIKATGVAPRWNFHKYLIGRNGEVIASFPSGVRPDDPELLKAIESALSSKGN